MKDGKNKAPLHSSYPASHMISLPKELVEFAKEEQEIYDSKSSLGKLIYRVIYKLGDMRFALKWWLLGIFK